MMLTQNKFKKYIYLKNTKLKKKIKMTKNKKITCLDCFLTLKFNLEGLNFKSECLLNHKHETDKIEYFLSDKIKEQNYCCLEHETQHYIQFCKQCNKNIL